MHRVRLVTLVTTPKGSEGGRQASWRVDYVITGRVEVLASVRANLER
jgi:hypothetical protein